MKINVLSIFSGIGGIEMGFSLEKRNPTDMPMHRSEAPLELWDKHKNTLLEHPYIYTNFTCENVDKDWIISVDISKSRKFGLHYLRHKVREYCESIDQLIISTSKIRKNFLVFYVFAPVKCHQQPCELLQITL